MDYKFDNGSRKFLMKLTAREQGIVYCDRLNNLRREHGFYHTFNLEDVEQFCLVSYSDCKLTFQLSGDHKKDYERFVAWLKENDL